MHPGGQQAGEGTTFRVYFPRVERSESISNRAGAECSGLQAGAARRYCWSRTNAACAMLACAFASGGGLSACSAARGRRARHAVLRARRRLRSTSLITDIVMPRMRGPELARELRRWKPDVKIVYMSGYLEAGDAEADLLKDAYFVNKPFSREVLLNQVAEALCQSPSVKVTVQPAAS